MSIIYITGHGGDSNTGLGSWIKEQCAEPSHLTLSKQLQFLVHAWGHVN